ncbi:hypothetical protein BH10PSE11_BH10PSE11_02430 [soil metagenome]
MLMEMATTSPKHRAERAVLLKKPVLVFEEAIPVKPSRADRPPTDGFILVVDGHFKTGFGSIGAAEEAALALKSKFQMLKVQTYDAPAKIWSADF